MYHLQFNSHAKPGVWHNSGFNPLNEKGFTTMNELIHAIAGDTNGIQINYEYRIQFIPTSQERTVE